MVKKGDSVTAEQVVARTELPGNVQPVKAASILGQHQQDLLEYTESVFKDPARRKKELAAIESEPAEHWAKESNRQEQKFGATLARSTEQGINWEKATYVRTVVEHSPPAGFVAGDFLVVIEHGGNQDYVKIDNCRKAKRGWVIDGGLGWRGQWDPDLE